MSLSISHKIKRLKAAGKLVGGKEREVIQRAYDLRSKNKDQIGGRMVEINTYGDLFPIEETLCNTCKFRLSRTLIPLNLDNFNISEADLKEMDLEEGSDIAVEQHTCLIIGEDMDYIVTSCNRYTPNDDNNLIRHDVFQK